MEEKDVKTYEARLNRLNEIVTKIENEILPLEETLSLYREGQALIKELSEELQKAEALVAQAEEK